MSQQAVQESPLQQGLAAAKANLAPGAVLIAVAVVVVVGYHLLTPLRATLDQVAAWKLSVGTLFAICSTAIFGGLLPVIVQQLRPTTKAANAWAAVPFLMALWAFKGWEIDLLYRMQAAVFGDNNAWPTVVTKVAVDQFVYNTLWGMPTLVLAYAWHDNGYNFRATWQHLGRGWYRRRVLPILIAGWGVWIPTVAVIYCIKLPLQLPVQNIVLCLWAIMVMFMTKAARTENFEAQPTLEPNS